VRREQPATGGKAGFTLIEILVVLAIMVVLAAVVAPFGARPRERAALAKDAREIAEALRLTRSRAIVTNRPMVFLVDVRQRLYRAGGATVPASWPSGTRLALTTTEDQELSDAVGTIRFYPDGSSTGGGVAIAGAGGRYYVLVDWLTGGVTIHERPASARR